MILDARFRPPEAMVPQPWSQLAAELARHGLALDDTPPRQFAGGLANLNYLVSVNGAPAVLRRPPPGPSSEGANDMAREWRVLSRLSAEYPLAPRGLHFCPDPSVLGAPFQLLEYRDGVAVGGAVPPALDGQPAVGGRLTQGLVEAMAALHALEPAAVGLEDLGRPEGFLDRQVEGWARRAAAVYPDGLPAAAQAVLGWLRRAVSAVRPGPARLVHGDLKFDNMLVDPATLRPVAVLDWDMGTRGDPLFDLAVLLSYWVEPADPPALHALGQVPSLDPCFPSRAEVAAAYLAASRRAPADLAFQLTLARFRLAIVWMQLYRRHADDPAVGRRYAGFAGIAAAVLDWTAESIKAPDP